MARVSFWLLPSVSWLLMCRYIKVMSRLIVIVLALTFPALGQTLSGIWDAAITLNDHEIPFRMEFEGKPPAVSGSFFNGDQKLTSTSGSFKNNALQLKFDYYGSRLEATLQNGVLHGNYFRGGKTYP